ncbi:hypothetical protein ASPACDRAFT_127929 [Aspergillus aculeatus ATCC 16872]|uniref:GPI anchored cell wall protein n=1 Tax=Aspergillus aculeatus (strain ATCC 16872 / CBS 172.66 / WB 5094) TaxID=690307 RepID=A0A1L9WF52_ASPA1|nr:uncharacterized protein ASPACDRAFT_127929 [Aspergillus aculeatus ATCC 16872]OJJ94773.1 hypothetical protein ASPACDRAFT_127929 [Aspergillus aculeatus ATCC 16872]
MMFTKISLAVTFALAASALPQPLQSSTTSSATATSSSSSASASSSSSTSGGGSVSIVNNMNSTVYLWSTATDTGSSSMQSLSSGGGSYSENWQKTSDGGVSIKLSTTQDESSVLQFEYTSDGETLYWDLSSINLDKDSAFVTAGFSATPSDSSCSSVTCSAGDSDCSASYQQPDDTDTNSCTTSSGITLTLG